MSNLPDGAMPTLKWRLLGPISPKDGSCQDLRWGQAPVAARGMFLVPSDIVVATNPVTLTQPGCYSYVAWLTETAKTPSWSVPRAPATKRCGSGPPGSPGAARSDRTSTD